MAKREHEVVIIGAGPGGYVAALRAAQLGMNVACVEKEPVLGGTCLRIGCIPSKALLESSERYWETKNTLARHGIRVGQVEFDLAAILQRKASVVQTLTKGVEGLFRKNKVTRYQGLGRLKGNGAVLVEGGDAPVELQAKHIIIATGSIPATLPGVELDGNYIGTSTEALSYPEVPQRLVVIGAGYIGLELGTVWQRLGAQVTVLEFLDRILPGTDTQMAAEAHKIFTRQGLQFQLGRRVLKAYHKENRCIVECDQAEPIECDRILLAVGRKPNTEGLGLESVGIQLDDKGRIPVEANLATKVQGIYAIGDVIRGPMLAHKAHEEGVACVEGIATGHGHVDYASIPSVVFTHPEIASVGKTEPELEAAHIEYRKGVFPFLANGRARILNATEGSVKILADRKTDRVLGVHILGPHAGDLIAEAAAAMAFGASSEDIARCCHAHPTLAEVIKEAALAVDQRVLHL